MRTSTLFAMALALVIGACNSDDDDKKQAGETCTPTSEGAAECESNVCLQDVQCHSGKMLNVYAGADCTQSGTCQTAGHECVSVGGTASKSCVPTSICN